MGYKMPKSLAYMYTHVANGGVLSRPLISSYDGVQRACTIFYSLDMPMVVDGFREGLLAIADTGSGDDYYVRLSDGTVWLWDAEVTEDFEDLERIAPDLASFFGGVWPKLRLWQGEETIFR